MNTNTIKNYSRLKTSLFCLPAFLLSAIVLFLYSQDALSVNHYIQIQKSSFFSLNHYLGQYPGLQFNLTQFGDCLISLSLLSIFIVYAPKIWESLISALLVSFLFSSVLKNIFAVPRPAAVFDSNSFIIVGEKLSGFNSLPSGHSVTVFTVLTVLLFGLTPQKLKYKITWFLLVVITGLMLALTRVGVGAHYPIDVIVGCIIGYISALLGIFISREYKICSWVNDKKYYLLFIVMFIACCVLLIYRIMKEDLIIFYLSLASLIISLYKTINVYAKNIKK
ncbi:MAG: phosphatase PAP2 family protein [Sphingobacteriales bacterium]|nr:phosphatase PAP2 family protein [Sphingobacteriales bacterium]OJY90414.1 MAG: phosphoesterase [Sphingobacteriales bacterium 44-15]